jgi:hypothetical protein
MTDPSGMVPEYSFNCNHPTYIREANGRWRTEVQYDVDGVIQGHDFAESAFLHDASDYFPYATCEFQIPFGTRDDNSTRGSGPYKGRLPDGFADLVTDYRGGTSAADAVSFGLYEFEPFGFDAIEEGLTEANGYIQRAESWQQRGRCRPGETYTTQLRVSGRSDGPNWQTTPLVWAAPRYFTLGKKLLVPIIGWPPIWRTPEGVPEGRGTWYVVVDEALVAGVMEFRIFKRDMPGDEQPYYDYATQPVTLSALEMGWVEKKGARWVPGAAYRPSGGCGAPDCSWGWLQDLYGLRWVGIAALAAGATALTVTAVGACVGTVACAAGVALGTAVVLATASSPNFARAHAAGVTLLVRDLSMSDRPIKRPLVA